MLKLVRSGPKLLVMESKQADQVIQLLERHIDLDHFDPPKDISKSYIHGIFDQATDEDIIIFLTEDIHENVRYDRVCKIIKTRGEVLHIQSLLINYDVNRMVTGSRVAPGLIMMKVIGDEDRVIEAVRTDHKAVHCDVIDALDSNTSGTVIAFTNSDIRFPVSHEDGCERGVYTTKDFRSVISSLRVHNLKYLNLGLHHEDWYELKIKIYDAYGHYEHHYDRLQFIMEKLDLGLVLGESWGTDAATLFLSVGVYKIRFFTFLNPLHIKRILLGLEFLENGERIVDYDLYHKRRKIHWDALREPNLSTREALSGHLRQEILSQLSESERDILLKMEDRILEGRKNGPS